MQQVATGAQALQAGAGAQQVFTGAQQRLLRGAQQLSATGAQQRVLRTLHFGALQQVLTGAQQAGAAGAQQAGAEQPLQPRLAKNAFASLASNTDRVTTATTMAANAANLRLIFFSPKKHC